MNIPSSDHQCTSQTCHNPAVYLCAGHECVPGRVNTPRLCRDCYLGLDSLVRTAFSEEMTQTCPHCGEVFSGPQDVLRVLETA